MQFGLLMCATDLNEGRSHEELIREMIDLAVEAEDLGYDYIWLVEHELIRFIINTSAMQEAVAIASRTSRIRIGAAVFVTPLWHPLLLAADIAEANILTNGRFEASFGRGGSQFELRQLQAHLPQEQAVARFEEFVDIMRMTWDQREAFGYDGEFFQFTNAMVMPQIEKPPTTWMASVSPESAGRYAASGSNVQFAPFRKDFSIVEQAFASFQQNRVNDQQRFMTHRQTFVADTMEQAKRILPLMDYHEHVISAAQQDGERVVNGVREWKEGLNLGLTDEEYLENAVVGDPATVVEKIRKYADLGIDQYTAYMTLGQDRKLVRRSMQLFAEHVIPEFTDMPKTRVNR